MIESLSLIKHASRAPGLRLFGLGAAFKPVNGLKKLQSLLDQNALWAKGRRIDQLKKMLAHSNVIISIWSKDELIGFGRATTDQVYRAVLWDIVVSQEVQGIGLGKVILEALLNDKKIKSTEKVYLMTTNRKDFYTQLGFEVETKQNLMLIQKNKSM